MRDYKATLAAVQAANPNYKIEDVNSESFKRYGEIYKPKSGLEDVRTYFKNQLTMPKDGSTYVASNAFLEKMPIMNEIHRDVLGMFPIQAGECYGKNTTFSAAEYHQGSEVNIAVSDMMLVLGKRSQMKNGKFDSKDAKIFYIPANTIVEVFSDTLHYSPCMPTRDGFEMVVVVIKGTNEPFTSDQKTDNPFLVKFNKFQMAHASRKDKIEQGIVEGVVGPLIDIKPAE